MQVRGGYELAVLRFKTSQWPNNKSVFNCWITGVLQPKTLVHCVVVLSWQFVENDIHLLPCFNIMVSDNELLPHLICAIVSQERHLKCVKHTCVHRRIIVPEHFTFMFTLIKNTLESHCYNYTFHIFVEMGLAYLGGLDPTHITVLTKMREHYIRKIMKAKIFMHTLLWWI